jgi:predicted transcriptional regulator
METELQRLTLRLSGDAMEAVRKIAQKRGLTTTEVIRRAIGTELFLSEAQERGERILLEDPQHRIREVVLR